ncbi:MAG TPA: CBS domain-containing protein [Candidatus Nitrosotenuis sp.]|nr:CBS domain-containing protein [Candidatus Nitrosotenuis sp.]
MLLKNPGLRDSLIKKAITVTAYTSLLEAIEILQKFRISRLVVIDKNQRPVAIITEKDILRALFPLGSKPIGSIQVIDAMSKNLITVKKSDSLYKCAKLMKDNGISSVVVMRNDNSLEGIVTKTDLVFSFLVQEAAPLPVSKIMTKKVVTVSAGELLFVVESILLNNKISRVPVLRNQDLVGIITYRDFVPARIPNRLGVFTDTNELRDMWYSPYPNQFNVNKLSHALTFRAEDIMTKNPVTMGPSDDVSLAALLMYRYDISGIPVMKNSRIAGIITKSDIVFELAKEA